MLRLFQVDVPDRNPPTRERVYRNVNNLQRAKTVILVDQDGEAQHGQTKILSEFRRSYKIILKVSVA